MRWQPIETAPRDAYILVWDVDSGVNVSYFGQGVTAESDEWKDGWRTEFTDQRDSPMILSGPVTHWMPLPEPPAMVSTGCGKRLAPGRHWAFCGETDMGQSLPALCTECGGTFVLAEPPKELT